MVKLWDIIKFWIVQSGRAFIRNEQFLDTMIHSKISRFLVGFLVFVFQIVWDLIFVPFCMVRSFFDQDFYDKMRRIPEYRDNVLKEQESKSEEP